MTNSILIEQKALDILHSYEGANNYILKLKSIFLPNKKGIPTRSQSEYIINNYNTTPKVAKKWVELDSYFSEKIANEKLYTEPPKKVWVEKLLVEKDKSYHIWGKFFESEPLSEFWLPKVAVIKNPEQYYKEIDYSKYSNRPLLSHQVEAVEKLVRSKRFILADDMGLGKGLQNNTLIYTPSGTKKIGEIVVGDTIIGSNGKPTKVIGVFPQGKKETYKVTFNDGFYIITDDVHLWSVSSPNYGKNRNNERRKKSLVLSTKQMYDGGKIKIKGTEHNKNKEYDVETHYKSPNGNNKWQIPMVEPIQFECNNTLPIDPYLLGLSLGDGHINKYGTCFLVVSEYDYDELFGKFNLSPIKSGKGLLGGKIKLKKELDNLKLIGCRSYNKFIPNIYKYTSVENRLAILQGLMDTDGHCMISKNGNFNGTEFSTISEKLCDDVCEIVQTLGGIARKKSRRSFYKKDGKKIECNISYRVNIKLPSGMNPFRLKRKSERYNEPKKYPTGRYITNIEKYGENECTCISVDSPDKLYVAEHAIVTHNTTSTVVASLETEAKKILIICPASLKINWQREIQNYTNRSTFICDGKKYEDADYVIVNYDIIKNFHDPKDRENSQILKSNFDLVIIDEAHYISNKSAQRTKLINDFVKDIDRLWLLTGTPMTSRPINYYNLLDLVESPVASNWMAYVIRYCEGYQFKVGNRKVWKVTGASNLEELRDRTSRQVLRRLKTDVLDLPEKIITPVYLRLKSKEYEELMGEYYDWYDKNPDESSSLTVQFTKLTKVRQVIAKEKINSTIELIDNILEQDKKVIIFTNFTESLQTLHNHYPKNSVYLDGSCSPKQRQESVDRFQNDDNVKVFIGNMKAAGVGITLTAAEAVIINDLSFVPGDMAQAEDRAYRYGQKNSVSVYYPIFDNTIEGVIYDIVNIKKQNISTVMGDNLDKAVIVQEIMDQIMSKR